ncbi:hypothetical protein PG997_008654 [Apiospora hydei]|uniref:Rhamnogalacturonase A/B/Epimerase-like pectate lyase domain-containing protein n=1 Tax=Apiospora hydei TaxID=1337664 RepID=A0ABR1WBE7_9PEZI
MASVRHLLYLFSVLIIPLLCPQLRNQVLGQFIQGYVQRDLATQRPTYWRPTTNDAFRKVVDLSPETVILVYNCWYMTDIGQNVENWRNTPRGQAQFPQYLFGYDLNTGKKGRAKPMRHDKEWYYSHLEPGTQVNGIANKRNALGRVTEYAKIRYTCDEYPPATWVEGGSGSLSPEAAPANAATRCAAMKCAKNVKAEQDWQGESHERLRNQLLYLARRQGIQFDPTQSVILFEHVIDTHPHNGVAASIHSYFYPGKSQSQPGEDKIVTQAKRAQDAGNGTYSHLGYGNLSLEEFLASVNATSHHIFVNDTISDIPSLDIPGGMGTDIDAALRYRSELQDTQWVDEDESEDDYDAADLNITRFRAPRLWQELRKPDTITVSEPKQHEVRGTVSGTRTPLLKNATSFSLAQARRIVEEAKARSATLNRNRLANPRRNNYGLKPGTNLRGEAKQRRSALKALRVASDMPLLSIDDTIAAAAALVAEAEATDFVGNGTRFPANMTRQNHRKRAKTGSYWMAQLDRKGTIFRNVLDYGAVGDGITDDTKAISRAMNETRRCGEKCNGSTTKNAIVYFPPGNYLISSTVPMPFGTQVIGDAKDWPVLTASRSFVGLGVLSSDEYTGGQEGAEQWYINTANFYRQVRNLRIDISRASPDQDVAGIHWQVAQATSNQNFEIIAAAGSTTQTGIFAENGSGGVISDITFRGGKVGLYGGEQQFTAQRMTFDGCTTGVQIIWDWGWVWKSITMTNVDVGFRLMAGEGETGIIGSAAFYDSSFRSVGTAVLIAPPNPAPGSGSTGVIVENVEFQGCRQGGWRHQRRHVAGPDGQGRPLGPCLLDSRGRYFERAKPQYEDRAVGDFVHVKDFGAKGDGVTVDTAAFHNPQALVKVGNIGDVGDVEMQDLIFTTRGPTAGAVMVQWNIRAASLGSAALWDCHVRIGGATGTNLGSDECPALTSGMPQGCNAGSLMMHLTSTASGYFENMWLWVADHMIDDPALDDAANDMAMTSIYVAHGFLIESTEPVWLYGTASEHATFYQYNFNNARNVFAGLLQTESPYYQPTPQPPAPFQDVVGVFPGDPAYSCAADNEFNGCDQSWAVIVHGLANIFVAGAGLYTWFSTYTQSCIDEHTCQKALLLLSENYNNVWFQNLVTIGAKYMAVMEGQGISALDNLNVNSHPSWSQISVLDVRGNGKTFHELHWLDPKIWDMERPAFTCSPPCRVKIPPWTGATSTVNYPVMTISTGSFSTHIFAPPLTISEWIFEEVTVGMRSNGMRRRQDLTEFWPVPATTSAWPAVTYIGPAGTAESTRPDMPFPTPPPSIEPGAAPPPKGRWPTRAIQPSRGRAPKGWQGFGELNPMDEDPYDEWGPDVLVMCPEEDETSSETAPAAPTKTPISPPVAVPSPMEVGHTLKNRPPCYNQGKATTHERMDNAIRSFCKYLGSPVSIFGKRDGTEAMEDSVRVFRDDFHQRKTEPFNDLNILFEFEVFAGCEWKYNFDECRRRR